MLDISVGGADAPARVLVLPVRPGGDDLAATLVPTDTALPVALTTELEIFLDDVGHSGSAGAIHVLPRPGRDPGHILLVGIGGGGEAGWRSAGAAIVRKALDRYPNVTVRLPAGPDGVVAARNLAEGSWLRAYRFWEPTPAKDSGPRLRRITLSCAAPDPVEAALAQARTVADVVVLARDLTNTPSQQKSPRWFADRVANAAGRRKGVTVRVLTEADLLEGGFGGILAVGGGSPRPPRLVELAWRPRGARTHVVLVGKGVTFDTGGISLKPLEGMKLMRKDMAGAAAVCAAVLGAADLELPVRVTALAPMAENMVSGAAMRPGDVVRHYGGITSEVQNTDAEGRLVLADALAYAVRRLRPDVIVDLATLTGAQSVALGKHTAALFTHDDGVAAALTSAGAEVGERMWRMPLAEDYLALIGSDVADLNNGPAPGQASAITAALYLREFTGRLREHWVHIDMSAPAWTAKNEGFLVKGATGWGVRTLLRWLGTL